LKNLIGKAWKSVIQRILAAFGLVDERLAD
jgi:hypothetical protein